MITENSTLMMSSSSPYSRREHQGGNIKIIKLINGPKTFTTSNKLLILILILIIVRKIEAT